MALLAEAEIGVLPWKGWRQSHLLPQSWGQTPAGARPRDARNPARSVATASLWPFPNEPEFSSRTPLALCQVPDSPAGESHCLPVIKLSWAVSPSSPCRDGCGHCRRLSGAVNVTIQRFGLTGRPHKGTWQSGLRRLPIHPHPIGKCEKHHLHCHRHQV